MSDSLDTKPPAQVLGVTGFDVNKVMGQNIDWPNLFRLPTFQKYVEERAPNRMGAPADLYAAQYAQHRGEEIGAQALYDDYCAWHAKTGLWPRETPDGRPK